MSKYKYQHMNHLLGSYFHQDFYIGGSVENIIDGFIRDDGEEAGRQVQRDMEQFMRDYPDNMKEKFEEIFRPDILIDGWDVTTREWLLWISSLISESIKNKDNTPFLHRILSLLQEGRPALEADADYTVSRYGDNEYVFLAIENIEEMIALEASGRTSDLINGLCAIWPGDKTPAIVLRHLRDLLTRAQEWRNSHSGLRRLWDFVHSHLDERVINDFLHQELGRYFCEYYVDVIKSYMHRADFLDDLPPTRSPGGVLMTKKDWLLLLLQYLEKALETGWPSQSAPSSGPEE